MGSLLRHSSALYFAWNVSRPLRCLVTPETNYPATETQSCFASAPEHREVDMSQADSGLDGVKFTKRRFWHICVLSSYIRICDSCSSLRIFQVPAAHSLSSARLACRLYCNNAAIFMERRFIADGILFELRDFPAACRVGVRCSPRGYIVRGLKLTPNLHVVPT